MNRGDVCLASFPFTDASGSKVRPVLVISAEPFNTGADIVVLPISSKPAKGDNQCVLIDKSSAQFAASGLRVTSSVKFSKPMTIAKSVIRRRLGQLHQDDLDLVTAGLISVIS